MRIIGGRGGGLGSDGLLSNFLNIGILKNIFIHIIVSIAISI